MDIAVCGLGLLPRLPQGSLIVVVKYPLIMVVHCHREDLNVQAS